jgi:hypothetical protein
MGLDDDYIKKLDDQKRLREEILRRKAEARKKTTGDGSERSKETERESSNSNAGTSSSRSSSIYINPKAFRGDLSALNLANMNVIKGSSGGGNNVKESSSVSSSTVSKSKTATSSSTATANSTKLPASNKPRTILKIVKDKHGNVISRSKVQWFMKSFLVFVLLESVFLNYVFHFCAFYNIHAHLITIRALMPSDSYCLAL